jgi:hypothetical protein
MRLLDQGGAVFRREKKTPQTQIGKSQLSSKNKTKEQTGTGVQAVQAGRARLHKNANANLV